MSKKRNFWMLFLAFCASSLIKNIESKTVTLPDWFTNADSMTKMIGNIGDDFTADVSWIQTWDADLKAQVIELEKRKQQRRELYECIKASFQAKEEALANCEMEAEERDAIITSLNNNIKALENTVASLTKDIEELEKQIEELHAAYATLLELNSDRVDELLVELATLRAKYKAMKEERDKFRTTLEDYYGRVAAYHHNAKTEGRILGKEVCGPDFDFVNEENQEG